MEGNGEHRFSDLNARDPAFQTDLEGASAAPLPLSPFSPPDRDITTGESIPLRILEGVPAFPGTPQDEAGLPRKFETSPVHFQSLLSEQRHRKGKKCPVPETWCSAESLGRVGKHALGAWDLINITPCRIQ